MWENDLDYRWIACDIQNVICFDWTYRSHDCFQFPDWKSRIHTTKFLVQILMLTNSDNIFPNILPYLLFTVFVNIPACMCSWSILRQHKNGTSTPSEWIHLKFPENIFINIFAIISQSNSRFKMYFQVSQLPRDPSCPLI